MTKIEKRLEFKVLGHGFIKLVDRMGNDASIVQSARVSYGEGTKTKRTDEKLIEYLWKNKHGTPFEMVVFKFHVKLPIFIARQWMRHRAATFNEISARYSKMKDCFYVPELNRIQGQSETNKQGSSEELSNVNKTLAYNIFLKASENAFNDYKELLNLGVSRELARTVLSTSIYTEFYWKVDLRNLLSFISLRSDSHAQFEIREYSDAIFKIIKDIVPITCKAYTDNV